MSTEIKAVLFDYGNVLCMPQQDSDLQAMAACLNAGLEPVTQAYWHFRDQFDLGTFTGAQYWTKIAEKCEVAADGEQLLRLIELDNLGWTRPNPVMAEWAQRLKENGIVTAIVSNMPADIRHYLRIVEWLPPFDHYSFSCELESLKPDSKIYEHTLESLGIHPSNALFLDDREVNVVAARKLGIEGFVFTDAESLHELVVTMALPPLRFNTTIA